MAETVVAAVSGQHGTRANYKRGCRCDNCRAANVRYECDRHRVNWAEKMNAKWVDAEPIRQHIRALQASGMGQRQIAVAAGLPRSFVINILYGRHGQPQRRVLKSNAEAALSVRLRLAGGQHVSAIGSARRLQALAVMGWPHGRLRQEIGCSQPTLTHVLSGRGQVTVAVAQKIAEVYDRLAMTPGPSRSASIRAKAKGWLPPLAWDDDLIDNLAAQPVLGDLGDRNDIDQVAVERLVFGEDWRSIGATRLERIAAAEQLLAADHPKQRIERQLGVQFGRHYGRRGA